MTKFGIDIGSLSGKLPSSIPTSVTTASDARKKETKTTIEPVPTLTPEASIKKVFDSVSTSISSITGGGSTTRKEVQNDDSKKAQQELLTIEKSQREERQKLVNRLKEEGTIKGKFAMNSDYQNIPELAALMAKQSGERDALIKRVDAGTSTETTFASGISKSQLVTKESPSLSISEGMKGYNSIPSESTVNEETEKSAGEIDLTDSGLGTKDLYDQLFQLNSSIRQLVEHTASGVDLAESQVKATRSLSGNRFA